jgi:hypothetical protein
MRDQPAAYGKRVVNTSGNYRQCGLLASCLFGISVMYDLRTRNMIRARDIGHLNRNVDQYGENWDDCRSNNNTKRQGLL